MPKYAVTRHDDDNGYKQAIEIQMSAVDVRQLVDLLYEEPGVTGLFVDSHGNAEIATDHSRLVFERVNP